MNSLQVEIMLVVQIFLEHHLKFHESRVIWDGEDAHTLNILLKEGVVNEDEILAAIAQAMKRCGRTYYETHRKGLVEPDHVGSPHCLAYAMAQSEFSEKELRLVKFDTGDTRENFALQYKLSPKDVLVQILERSTQFVSELKNEDKGGKDGICYRGT